MPEMGKGLLPLQRISPTPGSTCRSLFSQQSHFIAFPSDVASPVSRPERTSGIGLRACEHRNKQRVMVR